ncbi:MAG: hypothetical protein MMC33_005317 [Icmadophila ericetorum]|nr:hypothetical protein [Icmadophila ericetorum]
MFSPTRSQSCAGNDRNPLPTLRRPRLSERQKLHSYQVSSSSNTSPNYLEILPATTYIPPSPRGRLVAQKQQYLRSSASSSSSATKQRGRTGGLDGRDRDTMRDYRRELRENLNIVMPTPEEIIAATRSRRSSSTSSTSSNETCSSAVSSASSTKSERRRGCLFLDLLPENREAESLGS